ncbi:hypothetical protein T10_4392 [Trichinella papuae]|uniref:Uncharacterized protein n=1 Tax=Trichinella papuae TaxID=268474 RepID=A0A0V1M686_9BILA|nr:hypothetical protein T10_4392 [Trichinella papuae]
MEESNHKVAASMSHSFRIDIANDPAAVFTGTLRIMPSDPGLAYLGFRLLSRPFLSITESNERDIR